MYEDVAVRALYGISLALHNFFANIPLGLSMFHALYAAKQFLAKPSNPTETKLVFDILVCSIVMSVVSGFALEIEFARFWPSFDVLLADWNQHIGHKSAVISFFVTSALIVMIYSFRVWKYPLCYLLLSGVLVILAWLFSAWGVFLNTVMQFPGNAIIDGGVLQIPGGIYEHFFSSHHIARQAHIAGSSILKAGIILLLFYGYLNKDLLFFQFRSVLFLITTGLIILGISGHIQAVNISKFQSAKFSSMEGIYLSQDIDGWNVLGYMDKQHQVKSIPIPGGLQVMTKAEITPLQYISGDDRPNIFLVFNSFRVMLASFVFIAIIIIHMLIRNKQIRMYKLLSVFVLIEVAVNSGWLLSEAGRQPWLFYGLVKRMAEDKIDYVALSTAGFLGQIVLLSFMTMICCQLIKREHINNWAKEK